MSYPTSPRAKEISFKILKNMYLSNKLLHKTFDLDNNTCGLCEKDSSYVYISAC